MNLKATIYLLSCIGLFAASTQRPLMTDEKGILLGSTNFWRSNIISGANIVLEFTNKALTISASSSATNTYPLWAIYPSSDITNLIVDFDKGFSFYQVTNDVNFLQSTNRLSDVRWSFVLMQTGDTNRNIWFNTNWVCLFPTNGPPSAILSNSIAEVHFYSYGESEANVIYRIYAASTIATPIVVGEGLLLEGSGTGSLLLEDGTELLLE